MKTKIMFRMYDKGGSVRLDAKNNTLSVVFKSRRLGTVTLSVSDMSKFSNTIYPSLQDALPFLVQRVQQMVAPMAPAPAATLMEPPPFTPEGEAHLNEVILEEAARIRNARRKRRHRKAPPTKVPVQS